MKDFCKTFFFLCLVALVSCEEVVDLNLEESPARLVIEASMFNVKSIPENTQYIKLSTTAAFFAEEVPPATGAKIHIEDSEGQVYFFEEIDPGFYRNEVLVPEPGMVYTLQILYEDELYYATEEFTPVPDLDYVEQNDQGGFNGEEIELRAYYTDPADTRNFYLFRFLYEELSLQIFNDEFTNGNQTFAIFTNEDLKEGDRVSFEMQGISKRYYEYLFILRSQAGSGGGPFQTQPTTVRGNIVNTTNPENFPLGFFRLSEVDRIYYTVE